MTMHSNILVIGGGFAGFWAAVAARRVAGARAGVTLVSRAPVLEIRPRLYEAKPETLGVDILPHLAKLDIGFVRGEAVGLDAAAKTVTLAGGESLAYDRLVVATGSRMNRPPVPGAEAAFSVDNQAEAIAFDRRLAEIARDAASPAIAVVGAGFTGIELVLELRDRLAAQWRRRCGRACAHCVDRPRRGDRVGARARAAAGNRGGADCSPHRVAPRRDHHGLGRG
jgi:NADH dehydrogenase